MPAARLDEVMPELPDPPGVFVQLSETYAPESEASQERGWPVLTLDAHHLALLTAPDTVADAVVRAAARLTVGPGAERRPGRSRHVGP